jgi:hypothetical protein
MQPKYRVSRSHFLNQKDVPNLVDRLISHRPGSIAMTRFGAGDIFITPVLTNDDEKLEGLVRALPFTPVARRHTIWYFA